MKALVLTSQRELEIKEMKQPVISAGELLLQVQFAGICGSDLSTYQRKSTIQPLHVMGHEFSGIVKEVGDQSEGFKPGELVAVNPLIPCGRCLNCRNGSPQRCLHKEYVGGQRPGGFAEFTKVPASACFYISDPVAGALIEPLACGIRAVRRAGMQLGDKVVIFGAGMIGLFCMKVAELMGASERILIDTNDNRLELGKLWGANHIINPKRCDAVIAVQDLVDSHAVQKVIDAVGLEVTRRQGIEMLDIGGRAVWIGLHQDESAIAGNYIIQREIEVVGTMCYSHDDFRQAIALIENKVIVPHDSWLSLRPVSEGKHCFEEQITGSALYPKIMYHF
jgi:threonine dehydrogenase-like Zn-dependent dehydrogenase